MVLCYVPNLCFSHGISHDFHQRWKKSNDSTTGHGDAGWRWFTLRWTNIAIEDIEAMAPLVFVDLPSGNLT